MILSFIRIILGVAFALFIPGYLIVRLFFEEFNDLEKIAFSIVFSIMTDIAIAIFLGYNEAQALRTGGLTFFNIVKAEAVILLILCAVLWIKIYLNRKQKIKSPQPEEKKENDIREKKDEPEVDITEKKNKEKNLQKKLRKYISTNKSLIKKYNSSIIKKNIKLRKTKKPELNVKLKKEIKFIKERINKIIKENQEIESRLKKL
ncbi:DUF1616 domain-containing protein [Candidatus Woesearchaeota archaeon]|nr:DUF1616 domain-containing protein [Candidatus Woesearchaeota archaeon]